MLFKESIFHQLGCLESLFPMRWHKAGDGNFYFSSPQNCISLKERQLPEKDTQSPIAEALRLITTGFSPSHTSIAEYHLALHPSLTLALTIPRSISKTQVTILSSNVAGQEMWLSPTPTTTSFLSKCALMPSSPTDFSSFHFKNKRVVNKPFLCLSAEETSNFTYQADKRGRGDSSLEICKCTGRGTASSRNSQRCFKDQKLVPRLFSVTLRR